MQSNEEILSEKMIKFRVENNLTQEEFCQKCGIARSTLVLAEKGSPNVSKKMRTKIMLFIENNSNILPKNDVSLNFLKKDPLITSIKKLITNNTNIEKQSIFQSTDKENYNKTSTNNLIKQETNSATNPKLPLINSSNKKKYTIKFNTILAGKKFYDLTVIQKIENEQIEGSSVWICKCECGKLIKVSSRQLITGRKKSCGCSKFKNIIILHCIKCKKTEVFETKNTFENKNIICEECSSQIM